ncbi:hypothetical protein [uncultured Arcobacter sp.]|uniref:hypothetical protein n=1 Tax=uncultured Arcobacter sp. TaxID=165434 RepID=UPI0026025137|nr:hypothetical protein [uncultured Arcobacter sp.]
MITTKAQFKTYILEELGSPNINIEITDNQLEHVIQDGLDRFYEHHVDGLDNGILIVDTNSDTNEYTLPDEIYTVEYVFPEREVLNDEPLLVTQPMYVNEFVYYSGGYSLVDTVISRMRYEETANYFDKKLLFDYNGTTKRFYLYDVSDIVGNKVALFVHKIPNVETIYNNRWLKQYTIALAGIVWGRNISKYDGSPLPSGISINWQNIQSQYKEMKDELEAQLLDEYAGNVDMFWA